MKITEEKKLNIITDSVQVKGGADYTFVCSKIPFAVTCSTDFAPGAYNLIDLDLVNQMKIPLHNIKVTRMFLHGQNVRVVGSISQTVQCVSKGKVQGTVHLEAKVVRNMFDMFNVDCIASAKTFKRLTGRGLPESLGDPGNDDKVHKADLNVVLGGHDEVDEDEHLDQAPADHGPKEPDPPDNKLSAVHTDANFDDLLANAPWSRQSVPRRSQHWFQHSHRQPDSQGEDEEDGHDDGIIHAVASGYPDTRYSALGKLGPTDRYVASLQDHEEDDDDDSEEDDDDGNAALHGYPPLPRFGGDHTAHKLPPSMRNQPIDPFFAEHGRYKSQMLPAARKHCRMCLLSKQTPAVYLSHNTLDPRCPSTSDQDKERIRRKMEDGN